MKEQSHKDEMSAAIRGDFRRLRERGVAATLAPREEVRGEPGPAEGVPRPPALELDVEHDVEQELRPAVDEQAVRPGLLARLLGR